MSDDFHILLVEDSRTDTLIIERAIRESAVDCKLTALTDGGQALAYLAEQDADGLRANRTPDLILLDLNLPGLDGCQVLLQIKSDPETRTIPVVVLTTSGREEDVIQTYQAGANTCIQKPAEYPRYRELVLTLWNYWHEVALRPPHRRRSAGTA